MAGKKRKRGKSANTDFPFSALGGRMAKNLNISPVKGGVVIKTTLEIDRCGRNPFTQQGLGQHTFLGSDIGHDRSLQMFIKTLLQ